MWHLYFIRSRVNSKIVYAGYTRDIEDRLKRHNEKRERYTKKFAPFELIYLEEFGSKSEAAKREYYFKTSQGRAEKREIIKKVKGE